MYKIRDDRPLSAVTIAILSALHRIAERHRTDYFVIGATARDILMTHVFGIESGRATRDVDFAIALERWDQFELLKEAFIASGDFQRAHDKVHRLYYRQNEFGVAFPLDLIPFGKIEDEGHKLRWPFQASSLSVARHGNETHRRHKSAPDVNTSASLLSRRPRSKQALHC